MSVEILYPCPCCGELTMHEQRRGSFEICLVCGWEDDRLQWKDENEGQGANRVSLKEARENYKKYGVSDPKEMDEPNEVACDE